MMSEQIIITFNKTREDISTLLDQQVRINQALREEFASKSRKLETLVKKKQELEKPDANLDDLAAEIEKFSTQLVESVVRKQKELSEMSRKVSTEETDQFIKEMGRIKETMTKLVAIAEIKPNQDIQH